MAESPGNPQKRQRTPEEKKRFAALMVIFFTVFIDLIGFGIVIPVIQPYALSYGASDFEAGLLIAVFSIFQFIFSPVWGWLSDRFGRKPILLMTLLGISLSYLILGTADSLAMLFAGRILAGVFSGNIAVAQAYIADVTPPEKRAHGMGMIGAAFGLGFILGPAVGGILSQYSLSLPAYAAAGTSFLAFLVGVAKLGESLAPEFRKKGGGPKHPIFNLRKFASEKAVLIVVAINFLWTLTFSMWETVFVLFAQHEVFQDLDKRLLAARVGYMFAYMGFLSALIQGGLIRKLTTRWSEKGLAKTGFGLYFLGSLGFVGYDLMVEGGGAWGLFPALTLIALGQGLVNPTLSAIVSRLVDPTRQGEVMGAYQGMGSLGRVFGPLSGAYLFAGIYHSAPYIAGATLVILCFLFVSRRFVFYKPEGDSV